MCHMERDGTVDRHSIYNLMTGGGRLCLLTNKAMTIMGIIVLEC